MDFIVEADQVMWEVIYLHWVAFGGRIDEDGVISALLSLSGTKVGETDGYKQVLLATLTNPIDLDWVNQKAEGIWARRHAESIFSAN